MKKAFSTEAASAEQQGETAKAIESYKKALDKYREAGDEAGESSAKMQIEYLEKVLENEKEQEQ